jgi:hypothetical protein
MRIGISMGMRQPTALTRIQAAIGELQRIPGAHVYLPGEGSVLGMRAGNYIDSAGTLAGVLDSPVGRVEDVFGGIHASQSTTADKPVLKLTNDRYNWLFDTTDTLQLTLPTGYESATIIDATSAGPVTLLEQDVTGAYGIVGGLTAAELVTNGDFSNSLTGWENASTGTGTATATDGHIVLVGVDASNRGGIKTRIDTTVGRAYQLRWRVVSGSVNSQIAVTGAGNAYDKFGATTPGVFSAIFVASANPSTLLFNVYANGTVVVDDFSVKEILPSTHGRIILRDTPTARQLELCQGLARRLAGL